MKNTTFAIIAILVAIFVGITAFMIAYATTGVPFEVKYPPEEYPYLYQDNAEPAQPEIEQIYMNVGLNVVVADGDTTIYLDMGDDVKQILGIPTDGQYSYDSLNVTSPERKIIIR